jgi:hypothetical protein
MGAWWHHELQNTWFWAGMEIGGLIIFILIIWGLVALFRSGGGGGGGEYREYQARRSAINASEKYHSEGMRRTAQEYRRQHPR